MNPVKECKSCGRVLTIVARGMCGKCYTQDRKTNPAKARKHAPVVYMPVKKVIAVWETTDGREWGNEVDALRHQLELNEERRRR